jgi:hypothetical protein
MSIDDYAGGPGRGAASVLHRNRDGDFPDWAGHDLMVAYGDTAAAEAAIAEVVTVGEAILTRLGAVTRDGGRIVLSTVYDPSDGTGHIATAGLSWPDGPALVRALNAELAGLAQRHGAVVADLHARFLGHGVNAGDPAQPDARPTNRKLWYCGLIEPNAWGAHESGPPGGRRYTTTAGNHRSDRASRRMCVG